MLGGQRTHESLELVVRFNFLDHDGLLVVGLCCQNPSLVRYLAVWVVSRKMGVLQERRSSTKAFIPIPRVCLDCRTRC
jgi:hypothetical protein